MATESFPLKWPVGRERTLAFRRQPARFATTMAVARDELLKELKLLGARDVVISTNVATYRRGGQDIPYANQNAASDDPGAAVYYTWQGEQYVLSCDRWKTLTHNIQAINKTVAAIRGIERWGTGDAMKAAFSGFKALPQQTTTKSCWDVLGIAPTKNQEVITKARNAKALNMHPDRGGSHEQMQELNAAYNQAISTI